MAKRTTHIEKGWLEYQYLVLEKSLKEIGEEVGVCSQTVLNWARRHGIKTRSCTEHPERTKSKISKSRMGEKNPLFGKKRPEHAKRMKEVMKGRRYTEETRKKMSEAKKGLCGPLNNKWVEPDKRKGTLSTNIQRTGEMKIWRQKVLEEKNYSCQKCGSNEIKKLRVKRFKPISSFVKKYNVKRLSDLIKTEELWETKDAVVFCQGCAKFFRRTDLIESIRSASYYKAWRAKILERDKHACVWCESKNNLQIDHIIPLSVLVEKEKIVSLEEALRCKKLWKEKNARTLCRGCHKKTETYGNRVRSYA